MQFYSSIASQHPLWQRVASRNLAMDEKSVRRSRSRSRSVGKRSARSRRIEEDLARNLIAQCNQPPVSVFELLAEVRQLGDEGAQCSSLECRKCRSRGRRGSAEMGFKSVEAIRRNSRLWLHVDSLALLGAQFPDEPEKLSNDSSKAFVNQLRRILSISDLYRSRTLLNLDRSLVTSRDCTYAQDSWVQGF